MLEPADESGRSVPITPESVRECHTLKSGESLPVMRTAMTKLAKSRSVDVFAAEAFRLYARFPPSVPAGESGWRAKGTLSVNEIASLIETNR
jgi:hypothetical protein